MMKALVAPLAAIALAVAGASAAGLPALGQGTGSQAARTGTTYYVDGNAGSDASTGTSPSSAWKTLGKVDSTTFSPGDRILFHGGQHWAGELRPQGSGTAAAPISIGRYAAGDLPSIDAGGNSPAAVHLSNQSYWDIADIAATNSTATRAELVGILVDQDTPGTISHIHISRTWVHDVTGLVNAYYGTNAGIAVVNNYNGAPSPASHFADVKISSNTVTSVDRVGIYVGVSAVTDTKGIQGYATGVSVDHNRILNSGGDAVLVSTADAPHLDYNVAGDNGSRAGESCAMAICNRYSAAIWVATTSKAVLSHNEVYGEQTNLDGEALDADHDTTGTVIEYNYTHDNEGGTVLIMDAGNRVSGTVVRYNISVNDGGGIYFSGTQTPAGTQIYNNTFTYTSALGAPQRFQVLGNYPNQPQVGELLFANNIVYNANSAGYVAAPNATFTHNLFFGNHPASEPAEGDKLTANPGFVRSPSTATPGMRGAADLSLTVGSPALASGTVIADNGGRDFFGNIVPASGPSVGAFDGKPAPVAASLVSNSGFESSALAPWTGSGSPARVTTASPHGGSYALQTDPSNSGANQVVSGLTPSTSYQLCAWTRVAAAGDFIGIGAVGYGGPETYVHNYSTSYAQSCLSFVTGPSNTTATIYCYKNNGTGPGYCDDFTLTQTALRAPQPPTP